MFIRYLYHEIDCSICACVYAQAREIKLAVIYSAHYDIIIGKNTWKKYKENTKND